MEVFCLYVICFYYKQCQLGDYISWTKKSTIYFLKSLWSKSKIEFQIRAASEIIDIMCSSPSPFFSEQSLYIHAAMSDHQQGLNNVFLLLLLDINRVKSTICVPPKLLLTLCPHWEIPLKSYLSIHALVPLTLPPMHPCSVIYIHVSFPAFFFCLWLLSHEFLFLCLETL